MNIVATSVSEMLISDIPTHIHLGDLPTGRGNIPAVRKQLRGVLGDNIFYYRTLPELIFHLLKQITPVNEGLALDAASIERACDSVLHHLLGRPYKKMAVRLVGSLRDAKTEAKSASAYFCDIFLGLSEAPGLFYTLLTLEVDKDLRSISELIKRYEATPCIKEYLTSNKIPSKHQERITYDFYKRCVNERINILNYRLDGVKMRALEKASHIMPWMLGFGFTNPWADRPYHFAIPFSEHYFDSFKISQSRHRVAEIDIAEVVTMQELYEKDKASFYEKYFAKNPARQHINNIYFYLSHLPVSVGKRRPIFEELTRLFEQEYWIGFYALALPQIEGLFTEMCKIVSKTDFSAKGLPAKVKEVRPYYSLSESYFDYYEHYIPIQRNKFAHLGYDEDFQLKAYDMLTDLSHLLRVFYELENPFVKLTRLHKKRDYSNFVTIEEFVQYFNLLEDINHEQRIAINEERQLFEKEFLAQECSIEYLCYQMQQDLPTKLSDVTYHFAQVLDEQSPPDGLFKLKKPAIEKFIQETSPTLREALEDAITLFDDVFEQLRHYLYFIVKSKKYLPSLSKDIKVIINKLLNEYGEELENLLLLHSLLL